jgi:metal-responsive CopG/Arc/MetJ family transcriptional regulator
MERVMKNTEGGHGLAREERLQIMLSPDELRAVDTFRFKHRMPSRAAAVRELLRHGLASVGEAIENMGIRFGEYGVLKAPRNLRSVEDAQSTPNGQLHKK